MKSIIISLLLACSINVNHTVVTEILNDEIIVVVDDSELAFYGDGFTTGNEITVVMIGNRIVYAW